MFQKLLWIVFDPIGNPLAWNVRVFLVAYNTATKINVFPSILKENTLEQYKKGVHFIIVSLWLIVQVTEIHCVFTLLILLFQLKATVDLLKHSNSALFYFQTPHLSYTSSHSSYSFLITNTIILTFTLARNCQTGLAGRVFQTSTYLSLLCQM